MEVKRSRPFGTLHFTRFYTKAHCLALTGDRKQSQLKTWGGYLSVGEQLQQILYDETDIMTITLNRGITNPDESVHKVFVNLVALSL